MKQENINKEQLATMLSDRMGVTKKQATDFLDTYVDVVQESLAAGSSVSLVNFGSFKVKAFAARAGRNPQTGEPIVIAAQKRVSFAPGKALREKVKN